MAARHRRNVLAIVLAGGEGKRLMPLTADRAKPAVPFAGIYRLIDFALSNVVNSGYLKIVVLTQYKSHSLDRHVTQTWRMSTMLGNYVAPVPAQQRVGKHWYLGSADAIFQSLNLMNDERPDIVVVVGADHVYRMDFSQMVDQHIDSGAACTVAAIRQPISHGRPVRRDRRAARTTRTPSASSWRSPPTPRVCRTARTRSWRRWATTSSTPTRSSSRSPTTPPCTARSTTWAATSCPRSYAAARPASTTSRTTTVPGSTDRDRGYWRDVGTMASYYAAHMDVVSPLPIFNLYNFEWPIYTSYGPQPPVKVGQGADGQPSRTDETLLSPGVVITGGTVNRSVLSPAVRVDSGAIVSDSVLMHGVHVGAGAVVRNAIIDKSVDIPDGTRIGVDQEADKARGFMVEDGLTILGKGQKVES